MSRNPWVRFTLFTGGLMGIGYGLMKVTTPTPEQLYNEMSPDLKRKVDATRATRIAREGHIKADTEAQIAAMTASSEEAKPVWAERPSRG